jgi:hypothetical protein
LLFFALRGASSSIDGGGCFNETKATGKGNARFCDHFLLFAEKLRWRGVDNVDDC